MDKLPTITLSQAAEVAAAAARANVACLLLGAPGVGKTAITRAVAKAMNMEAVILIASNMEATDFAGLPFVVDYTEQVPAIDENTGAQRVDAKGEPVFVSETRQRVQRALFPEIERACREPVILFLDEITAIPRSVEAPMLRLALERNAGGVSLHPETRILMAGNPPEQAPGGITLSAAMVNRVVQVNVSPSTEEVCGFFAGDPVVPSLGHLLSVQEAAKAYADEAGDFSLAAQHTADLLQFVPPEASIADGMPWGSPRAWELGLRVYTALQRDYATGQKGDMVGHALLAGMVGTGPAVRYLAHRELRKNLPTPDQIARDPDKAALPTERKYEIASLAVIRRAAEIDFWAAFCYLDRLPSQEIKRAAASIVARSVPQQKARSQKWIKDGAAVFGRLVANVKTTA